MRELKVELGWCGMEERDEVIRNEFERGVG